MADTLRFPLYDILIPMRLSRPRQLTKLQQAGIQRAALSAELRDRFKGLPSGSFAAATMAPTYIQVNLHSFPHTLQGVFDAGEYPFLVSEGKELRDVVYQNEQTDCRELSVALMKGMSGTSAVA